MTASQHGDQQAYRRLLKALQSWLTGYYRRRLPIALVDDAVQEVLLVIHEKRGSYEPSRPLYPWVVGIARYKGIDQIREARRHASAPLSEDLAMASPENEIVTTTVLMRLMAALKPSQANAIRLVKLEGYTVVEASDRTGQSNSLVKVNIHRGLTKLATLAQGTAAGD